MMTGPGDLDQAPGRATDSARSEVRTARARTRMVMATDPEVGWVGQGQPMSGGLSACRIPTTESSQSPHPGVPAQPGIWSPYSGLLCACFSRCCAAVLTQLFHTSRKVGKLSSSMRSPCNDTAYFLTSCRTPVLLHIKTGNSWKNPSGTKLDFALPSAVFHTFKLK